MSTEYRTLAAAIGAAMEIAIDRMVNNGVYLSEMDISMHGGDGVYLDIEQREGDCGISVCIGGTAEDIGNPYFIIDSVETKGM